MGIVTGIFFGTETGDFWCVTSLSGGVDRGVFDGGVNVLVFVINRIVAFLSGVLAGNFLGVRGDLAGANYGFIPCAKFWLLV